MFYVGGDCANSNIELHDIRFSIGETDAACHEDLRRQWWGEPKSLHIDCWGAIEQADGFNVAINSVPTPGQAEKLFFLNLGGYDPSEFGELHKNVLLVAADVRTAIARALGGIRDWSLRHRDRIFDIEKTINLNSMSEQRGHYISLSRASTEKPFRFSCKYLRLT